MIKTNRVGYKHQQLEYKTQFLQDNGDWYQDEHI